MSNVRREITKRGLFRRIGLELVAAFADEFFLLYIIFLNFVKHRFPAAILKEGAKNDYTEREWSRYASRC